MIHLRTADSTNIDTVYSLPMEMDILLLSSDCAIAGQRTAITLLRFAALRSMPIYGAWGDAWIPLECRLEKARVSSSSPDGRYLLYTVADYGTFPFGTGTELQLMDCRTGAIDSCQWSAQPFGHRITVGRQAAVGCLASKRGDGQYRRGLSVAYPGC